MEAETRLHQSGSVADATTGIIAKTIFDKQYNYIWEIITFLKGPSRIYIGLEGIRFSDHRILNTNSMLKTIVIH